MRALWLVPVAALLLTSAAKADDTTLLPEGVTLLKLTETASRQVKQDFLTVAISIDERGTDEKKVQDATNRRYAAALEKAKAIPNVTVASRGYSSSQDYNQPNNNQPVPKRWIAHAGLTLSGTDIDAVLQAATQLQEDGGEVAGVQYSLTPKASAELTDELLTEAVTKLTERAAVVASAVSLKVQNIQRIEVNPSNNNRPTYALSAASTRESAPGGMSPLQGEVGQTTVQISVYGEAILIKD